MADEQTAVRYHRIQLALDALGLALGAAFITAAIVIGAGATLTGAAARISSGRWWQVAVVTAGLGIAHALVSFPLSYLHGYVVPRRFGLLHQPFTGWLADRANAAAFVVLVSAAAATIFPVWILPLFYRLTPLGDATLAARLLGLARRAGVDAVGVFVVDQSRKNRTANAALTGLGRTRRIVLFDTLLAGFQADEIESVLAHELGHHVHRDVARGLAAQAALTVATFWVADLVLRATAGTVGPSNPADPAGMPWLVAVLGALGLVAVPIANFLSRRVERQADDFALAMTRDPSAFIRAMDRLAALNLARTTPNRLEEVLLYSHPSVSRRIARARMAEAAS